MAAISCNDDLATFPERAPPGEGATTAAVSDGVRTATAEGLASRLVADNAPTGFRELGARAALGLGLASLYGLALGARHGGKALLEHAVGVPLGLGLVAVLGAPSLFVFLSLCRAPLDARALAAAAVRSVGCAGILLAGLAPAAALFVVTSETTEAARGVVELGLVLGGGVALAGLVKELLGVMAKGRLTSATLGLGLPLGFGLFAIVLATRVWTATLPILGGAS